MMTAMRTLLVAMGVPDAEILEEVFLSPRDDADQAEHRIAA